MCSFEGTNTVEEVKFSWVNGDDGFVPERFTFAVFGLP